MQVYRSILKKASDGHNDAELLSLMVDVYKAYRKIIKHMQSKEPLFATVLIDAYRAFISDKGLKLPDNASLLDLAVKLCTYEINYRKTQEKQQNAASGTGAGGASASGNGGNGSKQMLTSGELPATMIVPMQPISAVRDARLPFFFTVIHQMTRLFVTLPATEFYSRADETEQTLGWDQIQCGQPFAARSSILHHYIVVRGTDGCSAARLFRSIGSIRSNQRVQHDVGAFVPCDHHANHARCRSNLDRRCQRSVH